MKSRTRPRADWRALVFTLMTRTANLILYLWKQRQNGSRVHPDLPLEHWSAICDGRHNSNTDMTTWRGEYYLVHTSSTWHLASEEAKLLLYRSGDARSWKTVRELTVPGEDIRDPKLAVIGDRLFLYVLKNKGFAAMPYTTAYTYTDDGETWAELRDCEPEGWLFWRPKSFDSRHWYVPAYWNQHGRSILLRSEDGIQWRQVSTIYEGECNDETDIEFLPDGTLVATARLEVSDNLMGHKDASTLIAVSHPPYRDWSRTKSHHTRLDGPNLFAHAGKVFAVGRRHEDAHRFPFHCGSILGRKRTAIYRVEPDGLIHLSDLPSAGDTSYAGIVRRGEDLYVCYYTSDIEKDYPWILGMMAPTEIRMARIPLASLSTLCALEPTPGVTLIPTLSSWSEKG